MRKIVFRAREIGTKRWVFGDLEFQRILKNALIHEYRNDGKYKGVVNVENNTVGQFTGLCDSNGKDIYEGDIVKVGRESIMYIAWHEYLAQFYYAYYGDKQTHNDQKATLKDMMFNYKVEVIGNIHDSPEILNRQP